MTEESKKTRRTVEQRKLALQAEIQALGLKVDIKEKKELLALAAKVSDLAKKRPGQPTIGQAATFLSQAAAAIKADIPQ